MGRNGSGKSTLLRMLAFLEKPSSGLLNYLGGPEPRREVTLLLQNPYLLKCSVFDNVTLGLRLRGDRENLPARYAEAMRAAGFADPQAMASRYSSQLSGGERQRISLASRIILKPRVLLLDETRFSSCSPSRWSAGLGREAWVHRAAPPPASA